MSVAETDTDLVILSYADVIDPTANLNLQILKAYSLGGLGLLAIRGIPNFVERKDRLLPQAHTLAHLGKGALKNLEDERSLYNAGWSHGKEKLGLLPDTSKGSFYYNPLSDLPSTPENRLKYPTSYPLNRWPYKETRGLETFECDAKSLGCLMHDIVVLLSVHIDKFVKLKVPSYQTNFISDEMKRTVKAKARLLYYFPLPFPTPYVSNESNEGGEDAVDAEGAEDSWIGWHNDSGFLTALAGEIYMDDAAGLQIPNPDPRAGLHVSTRSGQSVKVDIPSDCLGVQLGECIQILSGGILVATNHCVRGVAPLGGVRKVSRVSLPCFIDTGPEVKLYMPEGCRREDVVGLPGKVPSLELRWSDGMAFGDFLYNTFARFYDHNNQDVV